MIIFANNKWHLDRPKRVQWVKKLCSRPKSWARGILCSLRQALPSHLDWFLEFVLKFWDNHFKIAYEQCRRLITKDLSSNRFLFHGGKIMIGWLKMTWYSSRFWKIYKKTANNQHRRNFRTLPMLKRPSRIVKAFRGKIEKLLTSANFVNFPNLKFSWLLQKNHNSGKKDNIMKE